MREPFFQFIALGLLIWFGVGYWTAHNDRYTIDVGPVERNRIATSYLQQYGELPTPQQLQGLIDRHIREEIFLHEGLALNLDKDDEIVRRRIVQKAEFLATNLAVPEPPSPPVLDSWYARNKDRYLISERAAFSQVYFSIDENGEEAADSRAIVTLKKLRRARVSRAPNLGDPFPGPADVAEISPEETRRIFGESDLSQALFTIPTGQWMGPYRSGYGWHIIYVTGRKAPVLPQLTEIHERVLRDYLDEQRRIVNERNLEKLRTKYKVHYDGSVQQAIAAKPSLAPEQSGTE